MPAAPQHRLPPIFPAARLAGPAAVLLLYAAGSLALALAWHPTTESRSAAAPPPRATAPAAPPADDGAAGVDTRGAVSRAPGAEPRGEPPVGEAVYSGPGRPASRQGPQLPSPDELRGIYLTGWTAGDGRRLESLIAFARRHGLNAMVIDAKDDDGRVTFPADLPLAREIGAVSRKIPDARALVARLEAEGIYPVARVVVFCDPVLARARPRWAVTEGGPGGRLWRDRRGLAWTSPFVQEVWEYNVDVAAAAAAAGFREIQFDYVRFPERDIPGFTAGVPREKRVAAVTGFLRYARERLTPLGVKVSADVFGLTTTAADDMKIGQEYAPVAALVDYVSPMVYPSHFNAGLFGLANPNARPYETVRRSLENALARTPGVPVVKHRPWIQDFSLYGIRYGRAEVEAQVRALADVGVRQFLVWNPNNVYSEGVDYSLVEAARRTAPGPLPPNELGQVMVVEYHGIGPREERWQRTPAGIRRDLEELYRRGYRPVTAGEFVSDRMEVPRGFSPVVLTFDDGSEGHLRLRGKADDPRRPGPPSPAAPSSTAGGSAAGRREVDPDSAAGVLLAFHREHPDWPLKATFFVNGDSFGAEWADKVRLLADMGFEVGNHTLTHADLGRLDEEATRREVGALARRLGDAGVRGPLPLALPYGGEPRHPDAARAGDFDGFPYRVTAFFLVGAGPAPSPRDPRFDPWRVPRIQAADPAVEPRATLYQWLRHFDEHPELRYVSGGSRP